MKQAGAFEMEDHNLTGSVGESPEQPSLSNDPLAEGDFSGPFGFGHPAHKPDPSATYTFRPGAGRPLPVDARKRWR